MVVVAHVRSFIGQWYSWLDNRGDERRNLIKLIKLFLIDVILDSDDLLFSRYNHLKSFVCCVWNIEHLSNVFCQHERLRLISLTVKVNANELIHVLYNTLDSINPVATEKRNLETVKVKLPNLLCLTIVHVFVLARSIISINTYTIILICAFLILLFSLEHVSIYVVPLICHNGEYRITTQLF
jgi:hypothetical protein